MSKFIALSEAPSRFLDPEKWAELRSFAKSDLIALTFFNAPYPDECEGPKKSQNSKTYCSIG
jgi:hypothetical protein